MIYQAKQLSPTVVRIRHKTPTPLRVIIAVTIPIAFIYANDSVFHTEHFEVGFSFLSFSNIFIWLILFGGPIFIYLNHSGYRIAWDDCRVYMRNWGFRNLLLQRHPYHAMTYSEMVKIVGGTAHSPGASVTKYMPYQSLKISSKYERVEDILIYASGLNDEELRRFLIHLNKERPDLFPVKVAHHMRKIGIKIS